MTFPGFIDLQVNGYCGVDFSSDDLRVENVHYVSCELQKRGVVGYCPTMITSSLEIYGRNLPILAEAARSDIGATILGVHLEGPFISPEDGTRGVHSLDHVTGPSVKLFDKLRELADDRIALITLAPELYGARVLIDHIIETSDVRVSLGHHMAESAKIREACDAGAKAATHLGNGLPEMIHRHNNPLWTQLADDRLTALVVTDGHHLPDDMIRVFMRIKGVDNLIVTSDMTNIAGRPPGIYTFHGVSVVLEENGRLHREGKYQLAGSACDMLHCMNIIAALGGLGEDDLRGIGHDNALRLLGKDTGDLALPATSCVKYRDGRFELIEETAQ
ncbi:N-acetylglucosamine-6-phosphate deacetylase [Candidatus Hydrogenedentota bacterium]